jgi:hypothetical protein
MLLEGIRLKRLSITICTRRARRTLEDQTFAVSISGPHQSLLVIRNGSRGGGHGFAHRLQEALVSLGIALVDIGLGVIWTRHIPLKKGPLVDVRGFTRLRELGGGVKGILVVKGIEVQSCTVLSFPLPTNAF